MGHHQGMDAVTRIRRLRLAAQHIEGSDFAGPVDVVRWMLAMQGQDLPGTKWSVGLRAPGCTLADLVARSGSMPSTTVTRHARPGAWRASGRT